MKTSLRLLALALMMGAGQWLFAAADPADDSPDKSKANPIFGQALIDKYVESHNDELKSAGFHMKPPGGKDFVIVAHTSRKHIGEKSDTEDLDAMKTGIPNVNPQPNGVWEVCVPLLDAKGVVIGVGVLKVKTEESNAAKMAIKYRDMMAKELPSKAKVFEKTS